MRTIDLDQPTIVVGDFNSLSNFCAPRRLVQLGFQDAFASMHKSADEHATWHWPTSPVPLAFRIDYIFHSSHLMTTKSEIVRRDGSDHYLVFADLNTVQDANLKEATPPPRRMIDDEGVAEYEMSPGKPPFIRQPNAGARCPSPVR